LNAIGNFGLLKFIVEILQNLQNDNFQNVLLLIAFNRIETHLTSSD